MFNLIARRTNGTRVRSTLKSHRRSTKTSGVLWILKKRFRDTDLVARYGGEEFVALVEGATAGDAVHIAEDVRAALEAVSVDIGTDDPIHVTVSAGCAELDGVRRIAPALSVADVWLSQAKRSGRNQVIGL